MPTGLRVATYNLQSFRAGLEAVLRVLAEADPDVVFLQECGSRLALQRLAGDLGMEYVSSHRLFSRVRNAICFRPSWRSADTRVHTLSRAGRTLPRGLIGVRLRRPGVRFTAVSAHLGLAERERERQVREMTDLLAGWAGPMVMGIDLNDGPEGSATRWVAERYYDAFDVAGSGGGETLPARAPTARVDYVFVGDGLRVLAAWVPSSPDARAASDHRPVFADLELPGPED